jgi:hypothetical protein
MESGGSSGAALVLLTMMVAKAAIKVLAAEMAA